MCRKIGVHRNGPLISFNLCAFPTIGATVTLTSTNQQSDTFHFEANNKGQ